MGGNLANWTLTGDPGTPGGSGTEHGYVRFAKETYADMIRLKAMQTESKIAQFLTSEREDLNGAPKNIFQVKRVPEGDGITASNGDLVLNRGRNVELGYDVVPTEKRTILPSFWEHAALYDPRDEKALLRSIAPDGQMQKAVLGAFMRKVDKYIIAALDADALVSEDNEDTPQVETFANDGGTTIDYDFDESGDGTTAGGTTVLDRSLNTTKLIEARRILDTNEALENGERLIVVCHPTQAAHLLRDAKVQDADFNDLRPLTTGQVTEWMGMTIISTNAVESEGADPFAISASQVGDTQTGRYAYAFTSDAVAIGADPVDVFFDVIAHRGRSLQALHQSCIGSVRLDGSKIVRIECVDAA